MEYVFIEHGNVKEPLCIKFFETVIRLQKEGFDRRKLDKASYKQIMPEMHIGYDRLQRVLNCIERNQLYFKIKHGWILRVSNIPMSVDWSKRFYYQGECVYHFQVISYHTGKPQFVIHNVQPMETCRTCSNCQPYGRRHYCQMKLQAFRQAGKNEAKDDIREILVRLTDTCELHLSTLY